MRALLWLLLAGCGFSPKPMGVDSKCPFHGNFGNYYCDGFENGINSVYVVSEGRAQVTVDGTRAYRGKGALHIHSNAYDGSDSNYIDAEISADASGPISFGTSAALRVYVFLPSLFEMVGGTFQLLALGDAVVLDVNRLPTLTTEIANQLLPTNRWFCLEVQTEPTDMGSLQTLLVDGTALVQQPLSTPPNLNYFALKLTRTGEPAPAMDLWYDELIVDASPIGCDR